MEHIAPYHLSYLYTPDLHLARVWTKMSGNTRRNLGKLQNGGSVPLPDCSVWSEAKDAVERAGKLIRIEDVRIYNLVGKGSFGHVYFGCFRGVNVAVKVISPFGPKEVRSCAREILILSSIISPHIVSLYGVVICKEGNVFHLVMELMAESLSNWIHGTRGYNNPSQTSQVLELLNIAYLIANAIAELHLSQAPVLHRDIKPSNIFFSKSGEVKLGDFGLARFLEYDSDSSKLTGSTGTFEYMAPEVIRDEEYGRPADIYSLGVMLIELITGRKPFTEQYLLPIHAARGVAKGTVKAAIPSGLHPEFENLIQLCIDHNPVNRPTIAQVKTKISTLCSLQREGIQVMRLHQPWYHFTTV